MDEHRLSVKRGQLRATGRKARAALPEDYRAAAGARIVAMLAELLAEMPAVTAGGRVLLTSATGEELDLATLHAAIRRLGATVALPVTKGDDLIIVDHPEGGPLQPGWKAVPEPVGAPADGPVDVVIVPALAVDRDGGRLGYGGGHFDRFLSGPGADAVTIGAVFACQLVREVPTMPHDVPLDIVVTEAEVVRPGAPAARG